MNIILLGAPGAGKGTQAEAICQRFGLTHIASGDLFREALEKETELGLLAKKYMEAGKLVPDEITIKMILEKLGRLAQATGCLFDGFPRTATQAEALDKAFAEMGKGIGGVIYIKVSEEELVRRLSARWICRACQTPYNLISSAPKVAGKCDKCGGELYQRPDDKEETVRERLKVFLAQTMPILDYYRKQDKLIEVNGDLGISQVAKEVAEVLEGKFAPSGQKGEGDKGKIE
jgi:adenylate kinase